MDVDQHSHRKSLPWASTTTDSHDAPSHTTLHSQSKELRKNGVDNFCPCCGFLGGRRCPGCGVCPVVLWRSQGGSVEIFCLSFSSRRSSRRRNGLPLVDWLDVQLDTSCLANVGLTSFLSFYCWHHRRLVLLCPCPRRPRTSTRNSPPRPSNVKSIWICTETLESWPISTQER